MGRASRHIYSATDTRRSVQEGHGLAARPSYDAASGWGVKPRLLTCILLDHIETLKKSVRLRQYDVTANMVLRQKSRAKSLRV